MEFRSPLAVLVLGPRLYRAGPAIAMNQVPVIGTDKLSAIRGGASEPNATITIAYAGAAKICHFPAI